MTGLAVKQYVHRTRDVLAALDEHVSAALGIDATCRLLHVLRRADFHICQILRLRYVRCQHLGKRQHGLNKCADRRRIHQRITVFGEHHRINHNVRRLVLCQLAGYRLHALRRGQHADFNRIRHDVFKHRVNLLLDHPGTDVLNVDHACGVFRHDRHDNAHAEHAVCRHGFQIGLYTCTAGAVRTGNGKHCFHSCSLQFYHRCRENKKRLVFTLRQNRSTQSQQCDSFPTMALTNRFKRLGFSPSQPLITAPLLVFYIISV